ncbi:hypothetical protein TNIN_77011 [Trichonephila inaurata madagascariensis]|uniref:Uncharacterized protein n=1 Tax=Trichonephila inaurata madagascariensis TaxID=2747483 RepID=A0A8X6XHW1_9ARAC|nr:hypothetical protein TNIN_77011 [Trichonephila inaurata madagascariensis]
MGQLSAHSNPVLYQFHRCSRSPNLLIVSVAQTYPFLSGKMYLTFAPSLYLIGWNDGCDLVLALEKEEMGLALFWVPSLSFVAWKVMQLIRFVMCEWLNKQ